jgi:hypothetical protein
LIEKMTTMSPFDCYLYIPFDGDAICP